jgi:hypothetical protein
MDVAIMDVIGIEIESDIDEPIIIPWLMNYQN